MLIVICIILIWFIRMFSDCFTVFLAVAIPNLEPLISLIGASCLSTVGIALPAIINCLTFFKNYQKKGRFTFVMFYLRTIVIVGIAVFAFIIGVATSVSDILEHIIWFFCNEILLFIHTRNKTYLKIDYFKNMYFKLNSYTIFYHRIYDK